MCVRVCACVCVRVCVCVCVRVLLSAAQAVFNAAQARRSVGEQKQQYKRASRSFAKTGLCQGPFLLLFAVLSRVQLKIRAHLSGRVS